MNYAFPYLLEFLEMLMFKLYTSAVNFPENDWLALSMYAAKKLEVDGCNCQVRHTLSKTQGIVSTGTLFKGMAPD